MHQNNQRDINFYKTYMFLSNFEVKNDQLRSSGLLKCDKKKSKK